MVNITYGVRLHQCENCLQPADQIATDYGDYCNRCWFTYKVADPEFLDMLERWG
ncbi:hypothetical protein ACFVJ5_27190 [Nocardia sp. NPDC127606]|uniref:hypothetical protein n=1 Tax=Nocardia sp. NPDC127606 TaxID=3345406 RepID=UPI00363282B9